MAIFFIAALFPHAIHLLSSWGGRKLCANACQKIGSLLLQQYPMLPIYITAIKELWSYSSSIFRTKDFVFHQTFFYRKHLQSNLNATIFWEFIIAKWTKSVYNSPQYYYFRLKCGLRMLWVLDCHLSDVEASKNAFNRLEVNLFLMLPNPEMENFSCYTFNTQAYLLVLIVSVYQKGW